MPGGQPHHRPYAGAPFPQPVTLGGQAFAAVFSPRVGHLFTLRIVPLADRPDAGAPFPQPVTLGGQAFAAVFSLRVGHLFTLWIVPLAVQKLFSLM